MKKIVVLAVFLAVQATSSISFAQEKLPIEARLSTENNMWAFEAGESMGTELVISGRTACTAKGLSLASIEDVKIKIETQARSRIVNERDRWTSARLFLGLPSGTAEAIAVCE